MQRVTIELSDVLYDELQTAVASIRQPGYGPANFAQEIVGRRAGIAAPSDHRARRIRAPCRRVRCAG